MNVPTWLEVSLTVDAELAEAVAELLARFAPKGVVIESTAVAMDKTNQRARAVGPLRVAAYLHMHPQIEDERHKLDEALWYLGRIRPLPEAEYRVVDEADWSEAWKTHYHPIPIGRRLIVVPAWLDVPDQERIPLLMDPGMAFGTGTHPTTQLCLQYIEELFAGDNIAEREYVDVIDIGCGSGILSIAALKLGARHALAVDVDPIAVEAAVDNAIMNGVEKQLVVEEGSLEDVLAGVFSTRRGHLVLANILAHVLVRLLDEGLADLILTGGSLVLSGIIDHQVDDVHSALVRNGLQITDRKQIDDWVALRAVLT